MSHNTGHPCAFYALLVSVLALAVSMSSALRRPENLVALASKVAPAVVAIECRAGGTPLPAVKRGSGVIVGQSGVIVTNFHVVKGAVSIKVTLHSGLSVPARLVGTDEVADIAILRLVGATGLPFLRLGRAEDLRVGQRVIALGNAHGLGASGEPSMTAGVISGKHRRMGGSERYEMDAQIYPGSSGGPVCDMSGSVVGISAAVSSHLKSFFVPFDAKRRAVLRHVSSGLIDG